MACKISCGRQWEHARRKQRWVVVLHEKDGKRRSGYGIVAEQNKPPSTNTSTKTDHLTLPKEGQKSYNPERTGNRPVAQT